VNLRFGLIAVGLYALMMLGFSITSGGGSAAGPGVVDPNDCTTFTPTPTVTQTPWPTSPFTPFSHYNICNDTGIAVSDIHFVLRRNATNDDVVSSPPGCPEPTYTFSPGPGLWFRVDIDWGVACVDPGEHLSSQFVADCDTLQPGCSFPPLDCFYWTLSGEPVVPVQPAVTNPPVCPLPSPTPPAGPCPARATPPVTYAPTPTPATATPTPGPTSRDVVIIASVPFCNDAGQAASDLHIRFALPYGGASVETNAPGCPDPQLDEGPPSFDRFSLDIDWGVACVDSGESVTLRLVYLCGDVPCTTPQPFCYTWTLLGSPLPSHGDCEPGEVTPTVTPTATPACPAGPAPSGGCLPCPGQSNAPGVIASTCVPVVTPTPTPTPEPSPPSSGSPRIWGDINCDGAVNASDALVHLRIGTLLPADVPVGCEFEGDVDCSGAVNAVDALKILRYAALLPVNQFQPCPAIGSPY
jgi:hypothetical protein